MLTLLLSLALAGPETLEETSDSTESVAPAVDEAAVTDAGVPAGPPTPKQLAPWARDFPGRITVDSPHYDLELMYFRGETEAGLAECKKRIEANPTDDVPYWMAARFLYEIGEQFERDDPSIDKEAHYQEMIDIAEAGLEVAPDNPHLHFALGIGHGRLGTTKGVLSSLFRAKTVEQAWLTTTQSQLQYAAIGDKEYLPCDAHQALAIYYRLVPDWWIVKMIAGTRGDLDKSLLHAEEAVSCAPGLIRNNKELGVTQLCLGDKRDDPALTAQGKATLEKAKGYPQRSARDKTDVKHIQMLLDDPSLACEYSRDGQQDLDESKLDK